jgi:aryl-alcohol dehydrogenase-like predicted oxidoreductase
MLGRRNRRDSVESPGGRSSDPRDQTDKFSETLYESTEAADKRVVDRTAELAAKRGLPQAQVTLAWMLNKPWTHSPIVGATKTHDLEDAIASLSVKLSEEEMSFLEEPYVPHPVRGHQ